MEIHEIRVAPTGDDPRGKELATEIHRTLGLEAQVETAKIYRFEGVTDDEAQQLQEVLVDPISEVGQRDYHFFTHPMRVEVAYKPGITNPEASSLQKVTTDLGIDSKAADSATQYSFQGVGADDVGRIASRLLVNEKIQYVVQERPKTLIHSGETPPTQIVPIREASTEQLMELSKDKLFLDEPTMKVIQGHFRGLGRDAKDAELEDIAGRWSEHCFHPTFKARIMERHPEDASMVEREPLMTRIRKASEATTTFKRLVLSAYEDNSGVMKFYDGMAICGKVETHNSPSAVDPYGGAMTGSGGVFRDIMGTGQGAETIISTDMFCFAPPNLPDWKLPPGTLPPDYVQRRVIEGVRDYGNRDGIPTANGSIHYHEDFGPKPTVIVGAYGLMPEKYAMKGAPQIGDLVVALGGRTGRDGIHGATFSSADMTDRTAQVSAGAVQIGHAIEEKRTFDAILEARDANLIRALTDCGAAGFSSAIGEMGEDIGVTVDMGKAPLKYEGLAPWEIWISESQERMIAAISPEKIEALMLFCKKHNVEATVLGEFDGSHTLTVNYGDENIVELDYEFLKRGLPQRTLVANWEKPQVYEIPPEAPKDAEDWLNRFKTVLAHGNIQSKEPVTRQYDTGVRGGNIVPPYGGVNQDAPNDALVIRPILGKPYGVVQSHGMNPILMRHDPYEGAIWATTEALANYVAVGGDPAEAVLINNYIWPTPDDESTFGSLNSAVDGVTHMIETLDMPVISGKDSLSSTYRSATKVIKIPPVLCMSAFGRIPDVEKTMTSDIKKPGESWLYLVGDTSQNMGGSAYYDVAGGTSGEIPKVNTEQLPEVLKKVHDGIVDGQILACHDVSEGGVITAVAEMCFGSDTGTTIHVPPKADAETFLYSETAGCFVVEVNGSIELEQVFKGLPVQLLGKTSKTKEFEVIRGGYDPLFKSDLDDLKQAWQAPMKEIFHG